KSARGAIARGTLLGSLFGILPGGGATMASFSSYALEKRVAKDSSRFGNGAIEGVAGPESANNAAAQTSFIPLLTMGLPTSATMALMIGALTLHGIAPGPNVIMRQPDLFWGLIVSMFVGNVMLIIINLPMIGLWVRLLRIPYRLLFLFIIVISAIGVYSVNNSSFDIYLIIGSGLLGYPLRMLTAEAAAVRMGCGLVRMLEELFRRSMLSAPGVLIIMLDPQTTLGLLAISAFLLVPIASPSIRAGREDVFQE